MTAPEHQNGAPFTPPVDDIMFSLEHVAGGPRLDDWDRETLAAVLDHFGSFAQGVLAPLNGVGDAQGARLIDGRVRLPGGFGSAYQQLAEGGWQGLTAPDAHGGMGLSPVIAAAVSEIFSGANHALQMICNLVPGAIAILLRNGTAAQQDHWIPKLASGEVLSTMCLTEPAAGSDLSAIRCKAVQAGASWKISGEKIFISGGDQDMSQGILHLVLARSGTVEDGVRGLSLFLCKAQPAVRVTRIEAKMGLHASPTCHMVFHEAEADLIGAEGEGLAVMFTLMNHARLDVALQGVAHATRAADLSTSYASERRQGRKADRTPAMLTDHADVRRMLDEQAALAMGARSMCHIALVAMERGDQPALVEFLTPLCKIFGSEAGIQAADLGIQILGGYGYLDEYGLSQVWRDARITSIYEGANGIHARSIATRGLRKNGGADEFAGLIRDLCADRPALLAALDQWQIWREELAGSRDPSVQAHEFTQATLDLFYQAVWARIAQVADRHASRDDLARLAENVLRPARRSIFA